MGVLRNKLHIVIELSTCALCQWQRLRGQRQALHMRPDCDCYCSGLVTRNRLHRQRRIASLLCSSCPTPIVGATSDAHHLWIAARPLHLNLIARIHRVAQVDGIAWIDRLQRLRHANATDDGVHRHDKSLNQLRIVNRVGIQRVLTYGVCRNIPLAFGLCQRQASLGIA